MKNKHDLSTLNFGDLIGELTTSSFIFGYVCAHGYEDEKNDKMIEKQAIEYMRENRKVIGEVTTDFIEKYLNKHNKSKK